MPILSTKRCTPPAKGIKPTEDSTKPIFEVSAAIIKSQPIANSNPPPKAAPLIAATVGIFAFSIILISFIGSSLDLDLLKNSGSAPAEKCFNLLINNKALAPELSEFIIFL